MNTTRIAGGLMLLALAAGLTACGSSSSSSSTSATGLSRTALAAQANKICATAAAQSAKVTEPANIVSDAAAAAKYFDAIFPISDAETKALQALTPDAAASTDWQAFVASQVSADQLLQMLKTKADAKDPSGVNDLKLVAPTGMRVAAAATKIGAKTCAAG